MCGSNKGRNTKGSQRIQPHLRKVQVVASIIALTGLMLGFQNCAQELPPEALMMSSTTPPPVESTPPPAETTPLPPESTLPPAPPPPPPPPISPLNVTPLINTIDHDQTQQLSPSGGVPPYTFRIVSGSGSVSAGGLFSPPQAAEANVIELKDSVGNTINSTITSLAPLKLATNPVNPTISDVTTFTASGGVGPYVMQFLSGPGSFIGTTYTPGATTGSILLKVTDSRGKSEQFSVIIGDTPKVAMNRYERITYNYDGNNSTYPVSEFRFSAKPLALAANLGFSFSGVAFYMFSDAGTGGRTAVTHCTGLDGYYIYSTKGACPTGFVSGGIVGYVGNEATPNSDLVYTIALPYEQMFSKNAGPSYTSFGYAPR